MKCVAAFLALAGAAQAFVAPSAPARSSALQAKKAAGKTVAADVEDVRSIALPFATKPVNLNGELVGDVGFDPAGFTVKGDIAQFRRAELKHGRVCMLAVTGALLQEYWSVQGPDFTPAKNIFAALADAPPLGLLQIFAAVGAYDYYTSKWEEKNGRVPGDVGFDPLALSKDGINENWALAELKHGRLAMIATLAFIVQALVDPSDSILEQTFSWANTIG